jgi:hypothetical protein
MKTCWKFRPYVYLNGAKSNGDRFEILIWENNAWQSVGGAIRTWSGVTTAFLCTPEMQRNIRTPQQAEERVGGLYVREGTLREALIGLKCTFPHPMDTLKGWVAHAIATF